MNSFYLVRHGDKEKTKGDPGLSQLGKKQAELTAKYLKKYPITKIFSGPFKRTQETAEIIARAFNLPILVEERLTERINWGDDPNLTFEEFLILWEKTSSDRDFKPEIGDSSRKAGKRLEQVILEISQSNSKSHIVLVTHGGIIVDFLRNVFSDNTLKKFKPNFLEEREKEVKECSVTIIKIEDKKFELQELASDKHLPFPVE